MELLKELELIDVVYEDAKATLIFLDEDRGEVREVNFNLQSYDNATGKYYDDPEKAEKVEKWCDEIFGLTFKTLSKAIGVRKDVYAYENFNSLFEVMHIEKFDEDMVGQIFEAEIKEIIDDNVAIRVRFEYDGEIYESKMTYAEYVEGMKKWFVNPQKKAKQYQKFFDKFQVGIDQKDTLIGKTVMVEIKKAMGKYVYSEIKPFPKKKK